MNRRFRRLLARAGDESGLTLVEMLVASAMSVILVGAVGSMLIGAMRSQPGVSQRAQDVSSSRWVMERLTREIRNGIRVDQATPSSLSLLTYVRRTTCGGGVPTSSTAPAIKCQVTYQCTTTSCTRREAPDGQLGGTPKTVFSGINSSSVFCYVPSTEADPLSCGPAISPAQTTYVGIRLRLPSPDGSVTALTVSDGTSLRNATLLK
jgi:type II secretory pathway pseudopilin PulG